MIYFITTPDRSRIKIGTTIRLSVRLNQLATEYGDGLEVLAVADGSYPEEKALHGRFAHLRKFGEWFEPGDDLIGFIVSDGRPWDGSDEVPLTGTLVTVERDIATKARYIAKKEGVSVKDLLSEILRSEVARKFEEHRPKF